MHLKQESTKVFIESAIFEEEKFILFIKDEIENFLKERNLTFSSGFLYDFQKLCRYIGDMIDTSVFYKVSEDTITLETSGFKKKNRFGFEIMFNITLSMYFYTYSDALKNKKIFKYNFNNNTLVLQRFNNNLINT